MCRFKLLSELTCFLPEELPLIFPASQVWQQHILPVFDCVGVSLFHIHFWKTAFLNMESMLSVLFHFNTLSKFSHCHLLCFWWEVICYWSFLVNDASSISFCFQKFCLWVLAFLLWYVCGFLVYLTWDSLRSLGCVNNTSYQIWGVYSHYLLEYFFLLLSFSDIPITSTLECLMVLYSVMFSFFFLSDLHFGYNHI